MANTREEHKEERPATLLEVAEEVEAELQWPYWTGPARREGGRRARGERGGTRKTWGRRRKLQSQNLGRPESMFNLDWER